MTENITGKIVVITGASSRHRRGAHLDVQRRDSDRWVRHVDDGDWATRYRWRRTGLNASIPRPAVR